MRFILILAFAGLPFISFSQADSALYDQAIESYMKGKYDSSIFLCEKLLSQTSTKNYIAKSNNLIGMNLYRKGQFSKSINFYEKALKLSKELSNEKFTIQIYINTGASYRKLGRINKAKEFYTSVLNYPLNKQSRGDVLNNLGSLYLNLARYDSALTCYKEAIPLLSQKYKHNPLNNIGLAYQSQAQYDSAYIYFSEAYQERKRRFSSNHPLTLRTQNHIAFNLMQQGRYEFAQLLLRQVQVSSSLVPLELLRSYYVDGDCLVKIGRREEAMEIYHKADSLVDHIRRSTKNKRDKLEISRIAHRLNEAAMEQCFKLGNYEKAFYFAERNKSAVLLETTEARESLGYIPVISPREIQNSLIWDQAVISYAHYGDSLATFVITRDTFVVYRQVANFQTTQYQMHVTSPFAFREYAQEAHQLYERLITPIAEYISNSKKLLIIPSKDLYIPFEALLSNMPNIEGRPDQLDFREFKYLIKQYETSYHFSATLAFLKERVHSYHLDYLGIAPTFGRGEGELPFNVMEVREARNTFSPEEAKKIYTGKKASLERMEEINTRVFHIATHYENESLVLANGSLRKDSLHKYRIETDLAILAGCQTFGGQFVEGEGLDNLVSQFVEAGAENVLFSYDRLYDKLSQELIVHFLEENRKCKSYAEALRNTKLWMMEQPFRAAPFFWVNLGLIQKSARFQSRVGVLFGSH